MNLVPSILNFLKSSAVGYTLAITWQWPRHRWIRTQIFPLLCNLFSEWIAQMPTSRIKQISCAATSWQCRFCCHPPWTQWPYHHVFMAQRFINIMAWCNYNKQFNLIQTRQEQKSQLQTSTKSKKWEPLVTCEQSKITITHGAEPFLRSCQFCSHSRTSQHFMEPEGSLPCSQEPSTGPYSESLRSILILSTHLRLGLPSGLAISSATALSELALYILLTFPVPNLISIFFRLGRLSKEYFQVRGFLNIYVTSLFFTAISC
jgi:hypothetical protein